MVFPWILEQGGKYRDRVDKVRKKREDRLDAQRKRNRKRISETVEGLGDFLLENPNLPVSVLVPVLRPVAIGFQAAEIVAEFAAEKTIEAGGVGAIDLFTPEIRRYEDTALVGMGGMII